MATYTLYPDALDTSDSLKVATDGDTAVNAAIVNQLREAIIAVEAELGIQPSSSFATVRARLDDLELNGGGVDLTIQSEGITIGLETASINFVGKNVSVVSTDANSVNVIFSDGYEIFTQETVSVDGYDQTEFQLANTPSDTTGAVLMFINGSKPEHVAEYSVSGSLVTYTGELILIVGDIVEFVYITTDSINAVQETIVVVNDQTALTLTTLPSQDSSVMLFISGAKQEFDVDYTVDGKNITWQNNDFNLLSTMKVEAWYVISGLISIGGGGGSDGYADLASTLDVDNITGGSDIVLSSGDALVSPSGTTGTDLDIISGGASLNDAGDINLTASAGGGAGSDGSINLNLTTGGSSAGIIDFRSGGSSLLSFADSGGTPVLTGASGTVQVAGNFDITGKLTVAGLIDPTGLVLVEQSTIPGGAPIAGEGTLWIRDDGPNVLVFTDDVGADTVLGSGGGGGDLATTLGLDNITGGNDIVLSIGDSLISPSGVTGANLNITSGDGSAGIGGDLNLSSGSGTAASDGSIVLNLQTGGSSAGLIDFQSGGTSFLSFTNNAGTPILNTNTGVLNANVDLEVAGNITVVSFVKTISLELTEAASVPGGAPAAGEGTLWIRDDGPNVLIFTDDAGTDVVLGAAGATPTLSAVLATGNDTGGTNFITADVVGSPSGIQFLPGDSTISGTGGIFQVLAGDGAGTGTGGPIALIGGTGGATGAGGGVTINAGGGGGPGENGGTVLIAGGSGNGVSVGGIARLSGGQNSGGGTGGVAEVVGGQGHALGGGAASLIGGLATSNGTGGNAFVTGGVGDGTGDSGSVTIASGTKSGGSGAIGNVTIETGSGPTGAPGSISLNLQTSGAALGTIDFQTDGTSFMEIDPDASVNITFGQNAGNITLQQTTTAAAGSNLNINTQASTGSTGGVLNLIPGSGSTAANAGYVRINSPGAALAFQEISDHPTLAVSTGQGALWVRDDSPNVLVFTDDVGTDTVLGSGGGASDLATTLGVANITGGTNIEITAGDKIVSADGNGGEAIEIDPGNSTGVNAGGPLILRSGDGNGAGGTGDGGIIQIFAGRGGTSGDGGGVSITAGFAGGGNQVGGDVDIKAGTGFGTGTGGNIFITPGGTPGTGPGGTTFINGGTGGFSAGAFGGDVILKGGVNSGGQNAGDISIGGGNIINSNGDTGTVTLSSGDQSGTASGIVGDVILQTGISLGSTDGNIYLNLTAGGTATGVIELQLNSTPFLTFDPSASVNMTFADDAGDITISQASDISAASNFIIAAQVSTGNGGGDLSLNAGDGATSGGALNLNAGTATSSGVAGNVTVNAGDGVTQGGFVNINPGDCTGSTGSGGSFQVIAGNSQGASAGGNVLLTAGNGDSGAGGGPGGEIAITAGNAGASSLDLGGEIIITGGFGATDNAGGAVTIVGGPHNGIGGSSVAGAVTVTGGFATDCIAGDVLVTGGARQGAAGGGSGGNVFVTGGSNIGLTAGGTGAVTITSGTAGSSGVTGDIGDVTLRTGAPAFSGTNNGGSIILDLITGGSTTGVIDFRLDAASFLTFDPSTNVDMRIGNAVGDFLLEFDGDVASNTSSSITISAQSSTDGDGGDINILAGGGQNTVDDDPGNGGNVNITAGSAEGTGEPEDIHDAGDVVITGGASPSLTSDQSAAGNVILVAGLKSFVPASRANIELVGSGVRISDDPGTSISYMQFSNTSDISTLEFGNNGGSNLGAFIGYLASVIGEDDGKTITIGGQIGNQTSTPGIGFGGDIDISAGRADNAGTLIDGGAVSLTGGDSGLSGAGGAVNIGGGTGISPNGDGGNVNITAGTGFGSDGIVNIIGDGYVTGDFGIAGKLTVDGLIDPTGLVLVEQATVPGGIPVTGEGTLWIRSSDGALIVTDDTGTDVDVSTGSASDLATTLGVANITGGNDIVLTSGDTLTTTGGSNLTIIASDSTAGGSVAITAGAGSAGVGGVLDITAGQGSTTGGNMTITSGQGLAGVGGDLLLSSGAGTTTNGITSLRSGGRTYALNTTAGLALTTTAQDIIGSIIEVDTDLGTHTADTANPHGTDVGNLGSGTLAELNTAITDATLDTSTAARPPTAHALGGADHTSSTLAQLNALVSDATLDTSTAARPIAVPSEAQGDLAYRGAAAWERVVAGAEGEVLTSHGTAIPTWETPAAGGGGGGGSGADFDGYLIDDSQTTADATPVTIDLFDIVNFGEIAQVELKVFAEDDTDELHGSWSITAALKADSTTGTVALIEIPNIVSEFRDDLTWDVDVITDGTSIQLQITGDAANSVDWRVVGIVQTSLGPAVHPGSGGGGLALVAQVTASTTITVGTLQLIDPTFGSLTFTAPASAVFGDEFAIKNNTTDTTTFTIDGNGPDIYDPINEVAGASFVISGSHLNIHYVYDGAQWIVI